MDDAKRTNVLLEELVSQFRVFGEGLEDVRRDVQNINGRFNQLESRFDRLEFRFDRMESRFDRLESRFDRLEATNSQEHQLMMQMIKELSEEQTKLKRAK